MVFVLLLTLLIAYISYYLYKNQRRWTLADRIPGPTTLPLIGNAHQLAREPHEIYLKLKALCMNHGDIFRLYILHDLVITITGVHEVEAILSSPKFIEKGVLYKFLEPWLGTGLLLSKGRKWRARRKAITPTFHFKILEQFISVFEEQSFILTKQLGKCAENGEEFDIYPYVTLCAMDIICESAMGVKINAQTEDSEYVQAVKEICRVIHNRVFNPIGQFHWTFFFSQDFWIQKRALKVLHDQTNRVIAYRKKELLKMKKEPNITEDEFGRKKKMAFLDLLLQTTIDGKPLSDESIREEVDTFMFEGHDTISSGISFALFNLAENPHIQEKVYQEVKEIFDGDRTRSATYADLQAMKYLELVIKETLRMHPPVPNIGRRLTEDIELNGYTIPGNTDVFINVYAMNHRADIFPNPERFDPERFASGNPSMHPYAYVPFSAGPRNCIGKKFAILEMKSTISKVIRNFELVSTGHKPRLSMELILRSMNGVMLKIQPRKY